MTQGELLDFYEKNVSIFYKQKWIMEVMNLDKPEKQSGLEGIIVNENFVIMKNAKLIAVYTAIPKIDELGNRKLHRTKRHDWRNYDRR